MLIDFHTHAFPDKLAPRALGALAGQIRLEPYTDGTISDLIAKMDQDHVDRAVVCNIATNPKQNVNVNNFAIETLRDHGDRLIPLGSIHPGFADAENEIRRLHSAGIRGLKIHPDYMGIEISSPDFDVIFDTASSLGMFIITHAGFDVYSPGKVWAPPSGILARLERSPDARLICAHFGGNMMYSEAEEKLIGKNLWIDASCGPITSLSREQAARLLSHHDPERILFGSDCPWCSFKATVDYIDSLKITDDLKENIFSKNALRLLG